MGIHNNVDNAPSNTTTKSKYATAMMSRRSIDSLAALLAIALVTAASVARAADDMALWLDARKSDDAQLLSFIANDANRDDVIRARITLADRAMNQSTDTVAEHLVAAEALLSPDTIAADIAAAIRCQLEHRQGLASAAQSCGMLEAADTSAINNELVAAFWNMTLGYYYYREGDHPKSVALAYDALPLAESIGDHDLMAAAHNMIGLHFGTQLRPRMSLIHFETALEHARQMVAPEFKILIHLNLASSYTYLGRAREALELLIEAQATPVVDLYPTRQLVVQSMIAQAKIELGDTIGVEQALLETIKTVQDSVLPDAMTFAWTGLGRVQLASNRPRDALANFDRVLATVDKDFETGLDHPRVQLIVVPYAVALRESGSVEEAMALLQSVVAAIPEDEPDQLLVDALNELAATQRASGDTAAALTTNERAVRVNTLL
ncbi:MAG: tetratricopeptide repeat protein, partial [Pseudomonadota bacterium]